MDGSLSVLLLLTVLALLLWQERKPDLWADFETVEEKDGRSFK
jgi:hypothetical protein